MLARLLLALSDPDLAQRIARVSTDPDLLVQVADQDVSLAESRARAAPDLVLVDRHCLGTRLPLDDAVSGLRLKGRKPEVLYLATDDTPEERASALAAGCLAVLDAGAEETTLEEALLSVVRGWREKAVQILELDQAAPEQLRLGDFVSQSPSMAKFMKVARRVCESNSSVLILGETGVGKERLASAMHAAGPRGSEPFVVVNCGAIPETLMESELFGHEKGAFTDAHRARRGHFEVAHGGTIFLDEIGEVPTHLQVKLLRVLQEKEIQRIGSEKPTTVDVRLIASTNRDLKEEMALKRFRPDLYYRLSVVTLRIPALRERREDIPLLAETYLTRFRLDLNATATRISPRTMEALLSYSWPGNVREVINVLERAVLLCEGDEITLDDLPEEITESLAAPEMASLMEEAVGPVRDLDSKWFDQPLRQAKRAWSDAFERTYLNELLEATQGRISETASRAGIDPRSLYDKMRRHGLRKEDFKKR
jgi:DNA-binding NtrC family response regulator